MHAQPSGSRSHVDARVAEGQGAGAHMRCARPSAPPTASHVLSWSSMSLVVRELSCAAGPFRFFCGHTDGPCAQCRLAEVTRCHSPVCRRKQLTHDTSCTETNGA